MNVPASPTSSAARTTAACRVAGSVTMTTTAGTTRTRRAAVCAAFEPLLCWELVESGSDPPFQPQCLPVPPSSREEHQWMVPGPNGTGRREEVTPASTWALPHPGGARTEPDPLPTISSHPGPAVSLQLSRVQLSVFCWLHIVGLSLCHFTSSYVFLHFHTVVTGHSEVGSCRNLSNPMYSPSKANEDNKS